MPTPTDVREWRLMAELKKCSQERATAEDRILRPHVSTVFGDQRKLLTVREVARDNYDDALEELKAYRKTLSARS
jgi:hypothetical protein